MKRTREDISNQKWFNGRFVELEVDTKVLVWDEENQEKIRRYFSHFDAFGRIYTFDNGSTSWSADTVSDWTNWELYEE